MVARPRSSRVMEAGATGGGAPSIATLNDSAGCTLCTWSGFCPEAARTSVRTRRTAAAAARRHRESTGPGLAGREGDRVGKGARNALARIGAGQRSQLNHSAFSAPISARQRQWSACKAGALAESSEDGVREVGDVELAKELDRQRSLRRFERVARYEP